MILQLRRTAAGPTCAVQPAPCPAARAPRAASASGLRARGLPAARPTGMLARRRRSCPAAGCRCVKNASSSSAQLRACCASDSSMLMRSMPSVYSPMRGSGITTSSLILKALVCLRDGGRARAVQPEFLARLRADGDEAFAAARIGDAHHFGGGARHGVGVVADDVAEQHHLRQHAALATWWRSPPPAGSGRPGAPGRPACTPARFCSANMKSLISTMLGIASLAPCRKTPGTRCACAPACGARSSAPLVIRPSQPSFWMPGRPARNLSVTSLPRPSLRKVRPGMSRRSVRSTASCRRPSKYLQLEAAPPRRRGSCRGCGPGA